ncbi:hypothetical protein PsAD14_03645 [Pseudovibrio sp. Ad14]|nr:hypothetical protein PsW74_04064 [Pseudovibrio sp. W74]KZL07262.1 hypothetical protein PsAD14_03645 [Pseudovibrio sp. Ad14]
MWRARAFKQEVPCLLMPSIPGCYRLATALGWVQLRPTALPNKSPCTSGATETGGFRQIIAMLSGAAISSSNRSQAAQSHLHNPIPCIPYPDFWVLPGRIRMRWGFAPQIASYRGKFWVRTFNLRLRTSQIQSFVIASPLRRECPLRQRIAKHATCKMATQLQWSC